MPLATRSAIAAERPVKLAQESRLFTFDFSLKLASGETLTGTPIVNHAPATAPVDLTVGSPAINGATVQVQISAGAGPINYLVSCVVGTSLGNKLECEGYLNVPDASVIVAGGDVEVTGSVAAP